MWHFTSSACVNKFSSLFMVFVGFFCREAFLSLMCGHIPHVSCPTIVLDQARETVPVLFQILSFSDTALGQLLGMASMCPSAGFQDSMSCQRIVQTLEPSLSQDDFCFVAHLFQLSEAVGQVFCHETFLSLMCSPASWNVFVMSFHLGYTVLSPLVVFSTAPSFQLCTFLPAFRTPRLFVGHCFLQKRSWFYLRFHWSDGEVDGDLRPILRPEPRK